MYILDRDDYYVDQEFKKSLHQVVTTDTLPPLPQNVIEADHIDIPHIDIPPSSFFLAGVDAAAKLLGEMAAEAPTPTLKAAYKAAAARVAGLKERGCGPPRT